MAYYPQYPQPQPPRPPMSPGARVALWGCGGCGGLALLGVVMAACIAAVAPPPPDEPEPTEAAAEEAPDEESDEEEESDPEPEPEDEEPEEDDGEQLADDVRDAMHAYADDLDWPEVAALADAVVLRSEEPGHIVAVVPEGDVPLLGDAGAIIAEQCETVPELEQVTVDMAPRGGVEIGPLDAPC